MPIYYGTLRGFLKHVAGRSESQYQVFPVGRCGLSKEARIEEGMGKPVDRPDCSSLEKDVRTVPHGFKMKPDVEVRIQNGRVIGITCLELGNCEHCRRRV